MLRHDHSEGSPTAGAVGKPDVLDAGYPGGRAWRTTSAAALTPGFDPLRDVSSIGVVAVAPSDADVAYVGTRT